MEGGDQEEIGTKTHGGGSIRSKEGSSRQMERNEVGKNSADIFFRASLQLPTYRAKAGAADAERRRGEKKRPC